MPTDRLLRFLLLRGIPRFLLPYPLAIQPNISSISSLAWTLQPKTSLISSLAWILLHNISLLSSLAWKSTHFFEFFVCVELFAISSHTWKTTHFLLFFICKELSHISCFSSFAWNSSLACPPPLPLALSARLGTHVSKWKNLQHRWRGEVIFEKIGGGGGVLSAIFAFFSKK